DWIDTFVHFQHYRGWNNKMGAAVFLYPYLGRAWAGLFGLDLFSFKMLDALMLVVMHVSVPFYLCREATERDRLLMASAGIIMSSAIAFFCVGYDSFSCLGVSFMVLVAWRYIRHGGLGTSLLLGCLTAIITAVRLPGLSMVGAVVLLMAFTAPLQARTWRVVALHVAAYAVSLCLVYMLLFKMFAVPAAPRPVTASPVGIYEYIRQCMSEESSSNHPLLLTLKRYLRDAGLICYDMAVLSAIFGIWFFFRDRISKGNLWDGAMTILFVVGLYIVTRPTSGWSFPMNLTIASFGYLLGAGAVGLSWKGGRRDWVLISVFLLCTSFVPVAGSNTGLIKTSLLLTFAAPVFLYFCLRLTQPRVSRFLCTLAFVATCFCLFYKLFEGKTLMDGRIQDMTVQVEDTRLKGVYTMPVRKAAIGELMGAVARNRARSEDDSVMYYGTESYIFRYLDPAPSFINTNFTMVYQSADDVGNFGRWLARKSRRPLVVLIFAYPEMVRNLNPKGIDSHLRERGYSLTETGSFFKVYAPSETR
ncbi:MAG: hypothetical protein EBZ67_08220, partial [Chitinophagia bacterium]|nr:hypothetical protein [Chitinophagia bacterium]